MPGAVVQNWKGTYHKELGFHQLHQKHLRSGGLGWRRGLFIRDYVRILLPRHELVPKYHKFAYRLKHYSSITESIIYSDVYEINGMEWRLKIYPKGNGLAKNSHISVFLELSKGYENEDKYEYKIELINHLNVKESTIREYASKFDIG